MNDDDTHVEIELLSLLESNIIITVLEDTVDQLRVTKWINNKPEARPDPQYVPLKQRLKLAETRVTIYHEETLEPYQTALEQLSILKLQKDRTFLEEAFQETLNDLVSSCDYRSLRTRIQNTQLQKTEEDKLIIKERKNNRKFIELKLTIAAESKEAENAIHELDRNINDMEHEIHDMSLVTAIKCRLVTNWEASRLEQHTYIQTRDEGLLKQTALTSSVKEDRELRISSERESLLKALIEKYSALTEEWMSKYDVDLEQIEMELTTQKTQRKIQYDRYRDLLKVYKSRTGAMDKFRFTKLRRERLRKLCLTVMWIIVKLKAWVRRWMLAHGKWVKPRGPGKVKGAGKGKGKGKKGIFSTTEIVLRYENQTRYWKQKYEEEMSTRNKQIAAIKHQIEEVKRDWNQLFETFKEQRRQMDEYLEEKKKQEEENERLRQLNLSATRIQAWWKGVMVRKGFGKWRKKAKPKPKSKEKGKPKPVK